MAEFCSLMSGFEFIDPAVLGAAFAGLGIIAAGVYYFSNRVTRESIGNSFKTRGGGRHQLEPLVDLKDPTYQLEVGAMRRHVDDDDR